MSKKLDELMYHSGLTAQGSWDSMDSYDQEAILKFAELIVRECAEVVGRAGHGRAYTTYDVSLIKSTAQDAQQILLAHFDFEPKNP